MQIDFFSVNWSFFSVKCSSVLAISLNFFFLITFCQSFWSLKKDWTNNSFLFEAETSKFPRIWISLWSQGNRRLLARSQGYLISINIPQYFFKNFCARRALLICIINFSRTLSPINKFDKSKRNAGDGSDNTVNTVTFKFSEVNSFPQNALLIRRQFVNISMTMNTLNSHLRVNIPNYW